MIQFNANAWGDPGVSTSTGLDTTRKKILIRAARPSGETLQFSSVGEAVGDPEGDLEGSLVVGETVGASVGLSVELVVGPELVASVAATDGAPDAADGAPEKVSVGAPEATEVGETVGEAVTIAVGGEVGIMTGGAVVTADVGAGVRLAKVSTNCTFQKEPSSAASAVLPRELDTGRSERVAATVSRSAFSFILSVPPTMARLKFCCAARLSSGITKRAAMKIAASVAGFWEGLIILLVDCHDILS